MVSHVQGSEHIFPSPFTGHPFASLFYPWDRIRRRAGLANVRLHDLRHLFASSLANQGVSPTWSKGCTPTWRRRLCWRPPRWLRR
jgi:integrase